MSHPLMTHSSQLQLLYNADGFQLNPSAKNNQGMYSISIYLSGRMAAGSNKISIINMHPSFMTLSSSNCRRDKSVDLLSPCTHQECKDLVASGDVKVISRGENGRNVRCYSNTFIMIYCINTEINLQDARQTSAWYMQTPTYLLLLRLNHRQQSFQGMCAITVNQREMLNAFKGKFTKAANSLSARLCTTHLHRDQNWRREGILEFPSQAMGRLLTNNTGIIILECQYQAPWSARSVRMAMQTTRYQLCPLSLGEKTIANKANDALCDAQIA